MQGSTGKLLVLPSGQILRSESGQEIFSTLSYINIYLANMIYFVYLPY